MLQRTKPREAQGPCSTLVQTGTELPCGPKHAVSLLAYATTKYDIGKSSASKASTPASACHSFFHAFFEQTIGLRLGPVMQKMSSTLAITCPPWTLFRPHHSYRGLVSAKPWYRPPTATDSQPS